MKKVEKCIQREYKNSICYRKMCNVENEKWEKRDNGKNGTNKSKTNQNAWGEGKPLLVGNIRRGHERTSGDERKMRKDYLRWTRKLLETNLLRRNNFLRYFGRFWKSIWQELSEMDKKDKKIDVYAQSITAKRWLIQAVCIKKRRRKMTR